VSGDASASHYPMFLNLSGRSVVVVGEGPAAERKASSFLRFGADVTVISQKSTDRLREMEAEGLIGLEQREYARGDLEELRLWSAPGHPRK
jgi:siroheme synthase (precorrin-2 oxidase/ferrochelatase)